VSRALGAFNRTLATVFQSPGFVARVKNDPALSSRGAKTQSTGDDGANGDATASNTPTDTPDPKNTLIVVQYYTAVQVHSGTYTFMFMYLPGPLWGWPANPMIVAGTGGGAQPTSLGQEMRVARITHALAR
jgi:hypothetical protein